MGNHPWIDRQGGIFGRCKTDACGCVATCSVAPLLRVGGIWRDVAAADLLDVFGRVAEALPGASAPIRTMLAQRFREPGGVTIAPVGGGYALPHPGTRVSLGRDSGAMALILLNDPLPPQDLRVDEVGITKLMFFIAPSPRAHLDIVGRISRLVAAPTLRDALDQKADDETIYQIFADADKAEALKQQKTEGKRR